MDKGLVPSVAPIPALVSEFASQKLQLKSDQGFQSHGERRCSVRSLQLQAMTPELRPCYGPDRRHP